MHYILLEIVNESAGCTEIKTIPICFQLVESIRALEGKIKNTEPNYCSVQKHSNLYERVHVFTTSSS